MSNIVKAAKPVASLSLDLDNQWSYMKTHGDIGWQTFPSYLHILVPRVLAFLKERNLRITFFVVGQDAALEKNQEMLGLLAKDGHEIGNHSFHHEPWLHLGSEVEIDSELGRAEEEIERATGYRPRGFRGPGFSFSLSILRVLESRGYVYDASTFPTFLGPVARAYYFMTAKLDESEMEKRKELFGKFKEGFRSIKPYRVEFGGKSIAEIPVTTMPIVKIPVHASYLIYLSRFSPSLAKLYFRTALNLCRVTGTQLSLLLHPLDFLGSDDLDGLSFFPGMDLQSERKVQFVDQVLAMFSKTFEITTVLNHVQKALTDPALPTVQVGAHNETV
jgi:hypothetical protein